MQMGFLSQRCQHSHLGWGEIKVEQCENVHHKLVNLLQLRNSLACWQGIVIYYN